MQNRLATSPPPLIGSMILVYWRARGVGISCGLCALLQPIEAHASTHVTLQPQRLALLGLATRLHLQTPLVPCLFVQA